MKYTMGHLSVIIFITLISPTVFSQEEETLGRLYRTGVDEIDRELQVVSEQNYKLREMWYEIAQKDKSRNKEVTLKALREFLKEGESQEVSLKRAIKVFMTPDRISKYLDIITFLNTMESVTQKDLQQAHMLLGILVTYLRIPRTINVTSELSGVFTKNKLFITTTTDKDNLFDGVLYGLGEVKRPDEAV